MIAGLAVFFIGLEQRRPAGSAVGKGFFPALLVLFFAAAVFCMGGCAGDCASPVPGYAGFQQSPVPTPGPTGPPHYIRQVVEINTVYRDGVPIGSVEIFSDNPLVFISDVYTDENGRYFFEVEAPDGTFYTLNFHKDRHIIHSVSMTVGEGGVFIDENTIYYLLIAVGYIPLDEEDTEGRVTDLFPEEICFLNGPIDGVVSPDGRKLYISDNLNGRIRVLDIGTQTLSTLCGSPFAGYRNGTGSEARFATPAGMAVTEDGETVYLCDSGNHCIRRIRVATGEVSLFAGTPEVSGTANGHVSGAGFYHPYKLAFGTDDKILYVADTFNRRIRAVDMETLQVANLGARLEGYIYGIDVHKSSRGDTVYVSTLLTTGIKLWAVDAGTGAQSFLAGGSPGNADGVGAAAQFALASGVAVSPDGGFLYVCDYGNHTIRKVDIAAQRVITLSGSTAGYRNGSAAEAMFMNPYYLSLYGNTLYVADITGNKIRTVDAVTGFAGKVAGSRAGYQDGPDGDSSIAFGDVYDVALSPDPNIVYLTDSVGIWKANLAEQTVVAVAPSCYEGTAPAYNVSAGESNRGISQKIALSFDGRTLYVADATCNMLRAVNTVTGVSTVLAGSTDAGSDDGVGTAARFSQPNSLVLTPDGGALYVTDAQNHRIRRIELSTRQVTTVAGSSRGFADGPAQAAQFDLPSGIAISPDGKILYVADSYNHRIRKIDIAGGYAVDTLTGGIAGSEDGTLAQARFDEPRGLALSSDGAILFVTDHALCSIREIRLSEGVVSTFAGGESSGYLNGTGSGALFHSPDGIAVAADGSALYTADRFNSMFRLILASSKVTGL